MQLYFTKMHIVTCSFFLLYASICADASKFRYDYWYSSKADGYMKLHEVPATFQDAFLKCSAEGTILASPLNMKILEEMKEKLQKSNSHSCGVYTGIHSSIAPGTYTTIEGVPLERLPIEWAVDEPDNYNNSEACIIMLNNANGSFADVNCNDTFPFFCYKKKSGNPVINVCGTVDNEYNLDARTGNCYKFHKLGRSWKRAYMTCQAEGGHLAVINSPEEAQVIKDIFSKHPSNSIIADYTSVAHIGFYDWKEYRSFFTIHGVPLEAAGFNKFGGTNPDNGKGGDGDAVCGGVYRTGELCDVWCNKDIAPFICEKEVDSLIDVDAESE